MSSSSSSVAFLEVVDVELSPVALAAEPGGVPRANVERVLRLDPLGTGAEVEAVDELRLETGLLLRIYINYIGTSYRYSMYEIWKIYQQQHL